jgi:hypothetical protein
MSDVQDEIQLGMSSLAPSQVAYLDLEELNKLYEHAVLHISDVADLHDVPDQIDEIVERGVDDALVLLDGHGVDLERPDARYNPGMQGAGYADDGVLEVGRSGRCNRPYYLVTELSHEMLHHYIREEGVADEYTAMEEGMLQVWNLHVDDVIGYDTTDRLTRFKDNFDGGEAAERLDDMRIQYNTHKEIPDGFGDEVYDYACRFLGMYDEIDGTRTEKMDDVLKFGVTVLSEEY